MSDDRPTWGHYPEGFRWRDAGWGDRVRVVVILAAIIGLALAGASDPGR